MTLQLYYAILAGFAFITDIVDCYQSIFTIVASDEVSQVELEVVIAANNQQVVCYILSF